MLCGAWVPRIEGPAALPSSSLQQAGPRPQSTDRVVPSATVQRPCVSTRSKVPTRLCGKRHNLRSNHQPTTQGPGFRSPLSSCAVKSAVTLYSVFVAASLLLCVWLFEGRPAVYSWSRLGIEARLSEIATRLPPRNPDPPHVQRLNSSIHRRRTCHKSPIRLRPAPMTRHSHLRHRRACSSPGTTTAWVP